MGEKAHNLYIPPASSMARFSCADPDMDEVLVMSANLRMEVLIHSERQRRPWCKFSKLTNATLYRTYRVTLLLITCLMSLQNAFPSFFMLPIIPSHDNSFVIFFY